MKKSILNIFIIAAITIATGCKNDNREAQTGEALDVAAANMEAVEFKVDATSSVIEWKGKKPTGTHTGTIQIAEGTFYANDSIVESGTFLIDMASINVTDLEGSDKENLENHLKGTVKGKEGDFFNINEFPNAKFEVTGVNQVNGQIMLQGNLTMKGETKNVEFPVNIDLNGEELVLTSETFTIDRTKWNVNFKSKSVFDSLGDNFINDEIELTIKVVATKA
ncbi:YceI family protein [Antarcticibacterium arcticum]|uniref:YceI family protein n=1 Tax=Antarcticibacterium arcticum TaxID=2585771 RepID=A0A5B8YLY2_9FLAO|nr:YceI family protein [Antarcticibacterium arcticum]QED37817.1 YceI family protein [Antarcticibacterium arcticum]